MDPRFLPVVDVVESNFGYGDHRTWPRAEREDWHLWAGIPIEECDCYGIE